MESLMVNKLDTMQKETGLELLSTYAFWRMYSLNADLKKKSKTNGVCKGSILFAPIAVGMIWDATPKKTEPVMVNT